MPGTSVKHVNGQSYLYFTCYDYETKRKKEIYCGQKEDPKSMQKAVKLEREYLENQRNHLKSKMHNLEERISRLTLK